MSENKLSLIRLKQAKAVKATGSRFKEARELCNMSLNEGARLLGYSNASKLSKVENATDTNSVPLWLIIEASKLYEVSTDFLLGTSDDWEYSARKTQEREISRFMAEQIERNIRNTVNMSRLFNDEMEWATGSIISMAFSPDEIEAAMKEVVSLNPEGWQDMRGGNKLVNAIEKAKQLAAHVQSGMRRFKRKLTIANSNKNQLGLDY